MRRYTKNKVSFPRNDQIRGTEFRVIDAHGQNVGVLSRNDAFSKAQGENLDVVLIAPKAVPPVVRIVDYEKYAYEQQKAQSALAKKQKQGGELKQFRFRPNIDEGDLAVRVKRMREFLAKGTKIKIIIPFFGRIIVHTSLGYAKIDAVMREIGDVGEIEQAPKMEGKLLITYIKPGRTVVTV